MKLINRALQALITMNIIRVKRAKNATLALRLSFESIEIV